MKTRVKLLSLCFLLSQASWAGDFSLDSTVDNKSTFWVPLLSLYLPGAGQFVHEKYWAMGAYSGTAVFGLSLMASAFDVRNDTMDPESLFDFDRDAVRRFVLGAKTYEFAGALSVYQSFRTAAKKRQAYGQYTFLTEDETVPELMLAPFDATHMSRWTAILPVGFAAGILAATLADPAVRPVSADKLLVSTTLSYQAGVGEELLFRGWLQPMLYQRLQNSTWTQLIQATVFAAAHISEVNRVPVPQFLFGLYTGYLVEERNWSLKEAIFIHTWWDILIFGAALSSKETAKSASLRVPLYLGQF